MQTRIDDLEADLLSVKGVRQKIDILNALAWELRELDAKRGQEFAKTAFQLAQTEQYQKGLAAEIYQLRNIELENEIAEHKRLEEQLHQQATTDVLTGAANRRHFLNLAVHEVKRALRFNNPLALALIDVDHLLGRADKALYQSKEAGRNRVSIESTN